MFHLAAFKSAFAAVTADGDCPAVTDTAFPVDGSSHLLPPVDCELWGATAFATLLTKARFATPRLRMIQRPVIRPIFQATAPPSNPIIAEYFRHPLTLKALDPLQLLVSTSTAVAENQVGLAWIGRAGRNVPQGDVYTIRWTATVASVAFAWTGMPITFDEILPAGRYSIIGMDYFAVTGLAARVVFPLGVQGFPWRPGCLAQATVAGVNSRYFRWGFLGEYGQFDNTALPTVEVLNTGAVATHEGYFDVVKVA